MEEKSLRITGANTTFFNKITKTLTKMLIPTKVGINGILISIKRNNLLKAFESYNTDNNYKKDELEKKYDASYTVYLEALDRQEKKENENPSVGVILCASKDEQVVEYAMSRSMSPTMVSQYTLKLIDKKLLEEKLKEINNIVEENNEKNI